MGQDSDLSLPQEGRSDLGFVRGRIVMEHSGSRTPNSWTLLTDRFDYFPEHHFCIVCGSDGGLRRKNINSHNALGIEKNGEQSLPALKSWP